MISVLLDQYLFPLFNHIYIRFDHTFFIHNMDTIYSVKRARQEKSLERLERLVDAFEKKEVSATMLKRLNMTRQEYMWCELEKDVFIKCAEDCRTYDYAVKLVTDRTMKTVTFLGALQCTFSFSFVLKFWIGVFRH